MPRAADAWERVMRVVVHAAFAANPEACQDFVASLRRRHPDATDRELAGHAVEHFARRAAWHGFLSSIPSRPLSSLALSVVDTGSTARAQAAMAACAATLADPCFFDDARWPDRMLALLAGQDPRHEATVGRLAFGRLASDRARTFLARRVTRLLAERTLQRTLVARLMPPLTGGAVAALWDYAELRRKGRRVQARLFDDAADEPMPGPAVGQPAA